MIFRNTLRLIVVSLITTLSVQAQTNYEQIVLEHFFENAFKDKYPKISTIQFKGCTDDELSNFTLFKNCFNLDKKVIAELDENAYGMTFPEKKLDLSQIKNITFKERKSKSRMRMYFYQANKQGESYYVILGVVKQKYFTHNYYYELGINGEVKRWCATGMTH